MPWNNGGPGPWGNPPGGKPSDGSGGGDDDKKPHQGPWGQKPPNDGGRENGGPGNGGRENGGRGNGGRGPERPGGPFGGGPFGPGGTPPDLDKIIEQVQGFIRGVLGGGGRPGDRPPGDRRPGGGWFGGFGSSRGLSLLGLAVVLIWMGTGFYRVQPDEEGVVLRFGAYSYWTPPGLHWHLPWPIEAVELPAVTRINRTEIGFRSGSGGYQEAGQDSGRDIQAESLMLTGDENIIDIDFTVFWKISDAAAFLFNTADPEGLVRAIAESSMRETIGRTPIQPALAEARAQIETEVFRQTQQILNEYNAGVEITQVQLQKVDPPAAVIESFRDVQRANTDAERMRNEAEAYRNDIVPRARGQAAQIVAEGQGAKAATVALATGQAAQFDSVFKAYQAAKDITVRRMYLDTMQDILAHSHPLVVDDKLKGVLPFLQLNPAPTVPTAPNATGPSAAAGTPNAGAGK